MNGYHHNTVNVYLQFRTQCFNKSSILIIALSWTSGTPVSQEVGHIFSHDESRVWGHCNNVFAKMSTLWFKKTGPLLHLQNSFTEYDPISVIFGLENRQRVFSLQVSNWRVLMKLGTGVVFYMVITICSRLRYCAKRTACFNRKSIWVQRLWSKETDERISDKMMEEDCFERFFETFEGTMYKCSEVQ